MIDRALETRLIQTSLDLPGCMIRNRDAGSERVDASIGAGLRLLLLPPPFPNEGLLGFQHGKHSLFFQFPLVDPPTTGVDHYYSDATAPSAVKVGGNGRVPWNGYFFRTASEISKPRPGFVGSG